MSHAKNGLLSFILLRSSLFPIITLKRVFYHLSFLKQVFRHIYMVHLLHRDPLSDVGDSSDASNCTCTKSQASNIYTKCPFFGKNMYSITYCKKCMKDLPQRQKKAYYLLNCLNIYCTVKRHTAILYYVRIHYIIILLKDTLCDYTLQGYIIYHNKDKS